MVAYFKPSTILELGTSLGVSTYAMALAAPKAEIISVEGSKSLSDFAKSKLSKNQKNIEFEVASFDDYIHSKHKALVDFIYIDGDHTKSGTINYFENLLKYIHNDSVIVFDDIYWSKGMTEAWEYIKSHPKVTVTVDTFFKGLVFFKKELSKENFKVRV